ncbi:CASP8 and FADD-like apoptosis regulator [Labeo rohita]|uniref:CASP8 and FADD-like apoptosis regulator n=1 Tax=Labeo rohita TaxID=84645 RepID=A0ABQ8MA90_LABRO|nr:CASP8 and FADD-like apoptosis regulator [Labeo rohita]
MPRTTITSSIYTGSYSEMADGFSNMVHSVIASLKKEEYKTLQYLCTDLFNNICVDEDLRAALLALQTQTQTGDALLMELVFRIKRFDILKKVFATNRQQVEGILKMRSVVSDYRILMADVSEDLQGDDLQTLIFLLNNTLPKERLARATSFLDVVVELEKLDKVSSDNLDLLEKCLRDIHRMDLVKRIQAYKNRGQNVPCAVPKVQKSCKFTPVQCQSQPALMAEYIMNPEQRGLCVIIDCVGFDGEMLNQTFQCLGFTVIFHSLLGLKETQKVLEDLTRNRILQRVSCFICCIISRGTDNYLLATDSSSIGIRLEDLRQLFSPTQCPSLCGKPKLFFTQIYRTTQAPNTPSMDDEYLETDAQACRYSRGLRADARAVPVSADDLWSVCRAETKLLEGSGHWSVYLHALNTALLRGRERRMPLLDVMEVVKGNVFSHNQQNPENKYHTEFSQTLRKNLYL